MAGNIYAWSQTAASNGNSDSTINFAEGQSPGSLNDSDRAAMAVHAAFLADNNATSTTGGTGAAYTVTSALTPAALATGLKLRLKMNATNTGACTLTVTPNGGAAFAAKAIRVVQTGGADADPWVGALQNNGIYEFNYDAAANSAAGAWILLNPSAEYVEGTFTPTFAFGGASVGITYTTQQGLYTRIGRTVHFTLRVTLSNKGSSTGAWTVSGLPLTSAATYTYVINGWGNAMNATGNQVYGTLGPSATTISIYSFAQVSGNASAGDNTFVLNTSDLILSGSYTV